MINQANVEKVKSVLLEIIENTEESTRDRLKATELLLQYHEYEETSSWIT